MTGGTLTLSGTNSFTNTSISGGTLQILGNDAIGTGAVSFTGDAALRAINTLTLTNILDFSPGHVGTVSAAAGQTLTLANPGEIQITTTAGTPTKIHFGTATDTGTILLQQSSAAITGNGVFDIFVDGGTLRAGSILLGDLTGYARETSVAAGAVLDFAGQPLPALIVNLTGQGQVFNDGSSTNIRNGSFAGNLGGTRKNVYVGDAGSGSLILTGVNTYTGGTTIYAGATLQLGIGETCPCRRRRTHLRRHLHDLPSHGRGYVRSASPSPRPASPPRSCQNRAPTEG